jgi:ribosomal protein L37AE/L43A
MNSTKEKTESPRKPEGKNPKRDFSFCPKCGSTSIFWASGLPQLWSLWECRTCGYRGALILKNGRLAERLQEEYAKKRVKP